MKIAIIVWAFPPKWLGGAEIATYNIARALVQMGHEVHIITSLDKGLPCESAEAGFYIHRVKVIHKPILFALSFSMPAFLAVKKIGPDIVHAQAIPMGLYALLIKKLVKIPYLVYSHSELHLSKTLKARILKTIVSKLALRNANAVIALTNNMEEDISRVYDGSILVIPNGVDLNRFDNLNRDSIRKKLGYETNERVVLYLGNLRPEKGVKYLVESMDMIPQAKRPRLLIVGDGSEKRELERTTQRLGLGKYINFAGKVPSQSVPEYMIASDVFVLPSLSEGFPLVILEAMAAGLPIVATRVCGIPEIIENGKNGLLVEPGYPKEIAEKILLLLESKELTAQIFKNNREKAKQYSWEAVCHHLEAVYSQVTDKV